MKPAIERIAEALEMLVYAECIRDPQFAIVALGQDGERVREELHVGTGDEVAMIRSIIYERTRDQ